MPAEIREIWSREHELEDAGAGPLEVPAIRVEAVGRDGSVGCELRLRERPREIAVHVLGDHVEIRRPIAIGDRRLTLAAPEAVELAALCAAWRGERIRWAAYLGHGEVLRYHGPSPLEHFRPGRERPRTLKPGDPEVPELLERTREYEVTEAPAGVRLGGLPVVHALRSGLDEPVGAVVRGPRSHCAVLLRPVLLVTERWPGAAAAFAGLACGLMRGIWTPSAQEEAEKVARAGIRLNVWNVAVVEQAAALVAAGGAR